MKYYWQQEIRYTMDVNMDVNTNQFEARQHIIYKNNSPDALSRLYFHLYFNAFQPGSAMDVRSRSIADPDPRIGARINGLAPDEQGYQQIRRIQHGGQNLKFEVKGTILEVIPEVPIKSGQTIKLTMEYVAQVPVQIRRSGRDNAEGIRYSMSQWYPKMCEYDRQGWHTDPYVAREFYGVWGDFEVTIHIDSSYTVAATGVLKNAKSVGHGYGGSKKQKSPTTTWNFIAKNVHDFVWAADPDYVHDIHVCKDGLVFHMFYQPTEQYSRYWKKLPEIMEEATKYINQHFGTYPYPQFSFIQGGDGGMEYPMATLITGNRPLNSLAGVALHEYLHSWFYGALGFNESYYYWMDEGFTDYAETRTTEYLKGKGLIPGQTSEFPFDGSMRMYNTLVTRGLEEPMSTHADHFEFNTAYSFAAYSKGSIFLQQLEYILGTSVFNKSLLDFFNTWKFKHPDVTDLILLMEKNSNLQLDWYKDYMVMTTKTIDYGIDTLLEQDGHTYVQLVNGGKFPMPVDLRITLVDGRSEYYTIPLDLMLGSKGQLDPNGEPYHVAPPWEWVRSYYLLELPYNLNAVEGVEIDPFHLVADLNRINNQWPVQEDTN